MPADLTSEQLHILYGLMQTPATVSPKYFYDAYGSALFERITRLDAYYPTRTERSIMVTQAPAIAQALGAQRTVIELGAGNCEKAQALCQLIRPACFVAVDISQGFLQEAVAKMQQALPQLPIHAVVADLTEPIVLPDSVPSASRLLFYPGSSIGNFDPPQALALLSRMRSLLHSDGALLIGVDLVKDEAILNAAYNDDAGITAAFNLNVLDHINRLIGSDFDTRNWQHLAFFNAQHSRIEMHLQARIAQHVRWPEGGRHFARGARIHTENSYKYQVNDFLKLLQGAGFAQTQVWTDAQNWFALMLAHAT